MKWITYICGSLCLFAANSVIAAPPVTMSGPTPAIAGSYAIGSSNTFTYTITNNVPNKSFPITVTGISGPVSRVTVANDCGSSLPKGPSTCNIGVLIAPTSGDEGSSFNQNLTINYQGRTPLVKNITFSVTSPISLALLTAVGQDFSGPPLLAQSTNDATIWSVKSVTGAPTVGIFKSTGCTGSGASAICVAAGVDSTGSLPPLLAASTDGGSTWAVKSIPGSPVTATFYGSSCTGIGSTAICTAVGQDTSFASTPPIVAVSADGGNTWTMKSVTGLPVYGRFNAAGCTGSGSTAVCAAAGYAGGSTTPLAAVSTDGGSSWAVKPITGTPVNGYFVAASCTGTGSTAICIAAGSDNTVSAIPLLAVSTDGGNAWSVKSVTGLPANGTYAAASCTGSGSTAICIAAGQDFTSGASLLAVSTDGANTWAVKSVTGAPLFASFTGASCAGSGLTAICTAVGQDNTGSAPPLLAASTDGANTWAVKVVSGSPTNGSYYGAGCTGNGSTAICTAVGQDGTGSTPPILAVSTNGANTWAVTPITGNPVTGILYAAGATGGS